MVVSPQWGVLQVADYRLYCLDGAGQIAGAPEVVDAASDDDAVTLAKSLNKPLRCEIWLGSGLVAEIPPAEQR